MALLFLLQSISVLAQEAAPKDWQTKADKEAREWMKEGGIPGLSLILIKKGQTTIKSYGFADLASQRPVTPATLFQLGSCSKAFTALAVQQLVKEGKIDVGATVTRYLPWFRVRYKDSAVQITILQLLHHTSGISWQSLSNIPEGDGDSLLEETVRKVMPIPLDRLPGKKYEYATVNYDILALIIQSVSGVSFEDYMRQHIFRALRLNHTDIGVPYDSSLLATGYRISFFRPRRYDAPVYRGNNAAGYVITDAQDMALWLSFQMGLTSDPLYDLAKLTHERDQTVALHGMNSYAMGWDVSLSGNGQINHAGANPNYTSYIAFLPGGDAGIAVLANSNSAYTRVIGERIMTLMTGEEMPKKADPGDGGDRVYSILSIVIALYILSFLGYLVMVVLETGRGKRHFAGFSLAGLRKSLLSLAMIAPFLYGLLILPVAIAGFSWTSIFVWTPESFRALIDLLLAAVAISYLAYFAGKAFPEKNVFRRVAPRILLMSILSGLSNMLIILLVTTSIHSEVPLKYLVFYYLLAVSVYLLGARFVQVNLIKYTRRAICELRITLIEKIFSTSCQEFEKMDRGRIYSALGNDVEMFGGSADQVISLITNIFTALGAALYLASIAFWTATVTILLVVAISALYFAVSIRTGIYFEQARDTQNVLMRLINGMIDGFKELSLSRKKKMEFKADVESVAHANQRKTTIAGVKFANAFVVGESMLVFILGVVVFAIPKLFSDIATDAIISFVIILLYLIGPVNAILRSVPAIMQIRIAWARIQQFMKDIPASLDLSVVPEPRSVKAESLRAESVTFQYEKTDEQDGFAVGPIDFVVRAGEILFIIGGNGSGKTTLAKLVTGLYKPDGGRLLINDRVVDNERLSEYFSAVFSPAHLFERLYSVDIEAKAGDADSYLKLLDLDGKVQIRNNEYSTIRLSGGQRKRLALLQCYLEDSPIYLFDEWAADQDPGYRRFFYRTLLPEMRRSGKIVIAITHDDHYFDVADKVMRMEEGRLVAYEGDFLFTSGHDVFKS